jgi:hypothetical protein
LQSSFTFQKDDLVNIITKGCVVLLYLNLSFNELLTDSCLRHLSKLVFIYIVEKVKANDDEKYLLEKETAKIYNI